MKGILSVLLAPLAAVLFSSLAAASEGGYRLERAPIDPTDIGSLQAGARTFVNYCLNCHGAAYMRYNRLTDLGLTEAQIRDNLMFASDKVGETMKVALSAKDGKQWFGAPPPDLSVIARSRGADWLYTYLRTFYRDPKSATGWNNATFPSVSMPHVLWALQGEKGLEVVETKDGSGHVSHEHKWTTISEGRQNAVQYDTTVRDLVNYLVYMGEPSATKRKLIGAAALFVLAVLFVLAYAMKRDFWKDVH
ncbi:MAG: cytochrome c1 [Betaproteobacteria bacterium]|nr:cytochrome c1 [Betaproteobacteria bacterium]